MKSLCLTTLAILVSVTLQAQIINTVAGKSTSPFTGDGDYANTAQLTPDGIVADDNNHLLYIADPGSNQIKRVYTIGLAGTDTCVGIINTFAGNGSASYSGDGGPATAAGLLSPTGVTRDGSGNIYIADYGNNRIRKINAAGIINTVAGSGVGGYLGDGGAATAAQLLSPRGMIVDGSGNIYIADLGNGRVRKVTAGTGIITTVAGNGGLSYAGDGGSATLASLEPYGIAIDGSGNIYVADNSNHRIRKINTSGIITTVAGNGIGGYSGDGGPATAASLYYPCGIAFDAAGNLYIADRDNNRIRMVNTSGNITTVAGNGSYGITGDGGPATAASLYSPQAVALGNNGNIYEAQSNSVRLIGTFTKYIGKIMPTGYNALCVGVTMPLSDSTSGGTWSTSNTTAESINNVGGTYSVTGLAIGMGVITYSIQGAFAVNYADVIPFPGPINGISDVCGPGTTFMLSDATAGGLWSSSNTGVATVNTSMGMVTAASTGSAVISYYLPYKYGCIVTHTVTVAGGGPPLPPPISFVGSTTFCQGTNISLSDATPGGTWSSSNTAIATVSASGDVWGASGGSCMISYTTSNGCGSSPPATLSVNIEPLIPNPGSIVGPLSVCAGSNIALTDIVAGGAWSSSNTAVATVDGVGNVHGVTGGTVTITYTVPSSCGGSSAFAVAMVTINPLPPLPANITGSGPLCVGTTLPLSDITTGGTWSSFTPSVVTVTATGIVSGAAPGIGIISYTLTNSCGSTAVTTSVTVNPLPDAGVIYGSGSLCGVTPVSLSDGAGGGVWSSSNTAVATINAAGVAYGVSPGSVIISYTVTNLCGTATATHAVAVNSLPSPGTISGPSSGCVGSTFTLFNGTTGGSWSSSNAGIAAISSGGIVSGITAGPATIKYTVSGTCGSAFTTYAITILPALPVVGAITGMAPICIGNTITLSDTTAAGIWSSDDPTIATIDATGVVSGVNGGTANISYAVTNSCGTTVVTAGVTIGSTITTHYINYAAATTCTAPDFYVAACGSSSAYNVTTFFGDGTYINTPLTVTGGIYGAHVFHNYAAPGNYWVRQELHNGSTGMALDVKEFNLTFTGCVLPIELYDDFNSNCVFDATDIYNVIPLVIEVDSNSVPVATISATSGLYYTPPLGVPAGTVYAFRVLPSSTTMAVTCPVSGVIYDTIQTFVNNYPVKYFGLNCNSSSAFDLAINLSTNSGINRCLSTVLVHNNTSCISPPATVTVTLNPLYPSIYFTSPPPASVSGTTVTWNIGSLAYNSVVCLYAYGDASPTVPIGTVVQTTASVSPVSGDANPANNTAIKVDTVRAPADPNDMSVNPEGQILAGTELEYTVHFENVGNDTAHNIYIMDTLSDDLLINTLTIVTASAPMNIAHLTDAAGHNVIKFDFPAINLLDSSHHGLCDGMAIFKIKTKTGLPNGTIIPNKAAIYFDYNMPVLTNTVTDIIGIPITSVSGIAKNQVKIYPNPANDVLTLQIAKDAYNEYTITNQVGQELMQQSITGTNTRINIVSLPPGMYYITLRGDNGTRTEKFVKI